MERERCPACGRDVTTLSAFLIHLRAVADKAPHASALCALLGIDYATLQAAQQARDELSRGPD